jgi:hypothetical protein
MVTENYPWTEVICQQCKRKFMTPFPLSRKYCHTNCKVLAHRIKHGAKPRAHHKLGEITGKAIPNR